MTNKVMRQLFEYDEWATNRTLDSVASLSEEQFKRELKSSHGRNSENTRPHLFGRLDMD